MSLDSPQASVRGRERPALGTVSGSGWRGGSAVSFSLVSVRVHFPQMSSNSTKRAPTTATQRLKQDYLRIKKDPVPYICAEPLPSNILEW